MNTQRRGARNANPRRQTQDGASSRHEVPLSQVLSRLQRLTITLFFSQKKQSNFVESMMIIKTGSSREGGEADISVLKKMEQIYLKTNSMVKVEFHVCKVLVKRMEAGMTLGDAMNGVFSPQYCNLLSAMNTGSKIVDAVKSATDRQKAMNAAEFMSTIKIGAGYLAIVGTCNLLHLLYNAYIERKAEAPKAFRYFREPETQFAIANFVADYTLVIFALTIVFILINRKVVPNLSGNTRALADSYYPPSWLYKSKLAVSMFSNITLLIKDAGVKPIAAINTLLSRAKPYEKDHLLMIKNSMSRGDEGTDQFSTGLLPPLLDLQLKLAGQGEGSSVNTALQIISTSGQSELVKTMKRTSTYMLVGMGFFSIWIAAGGISTGFY
ncbi:hypothetical protein ACNO5E_18700, partial [Vibrio parahaemolyticus]